MMPCISLFRKFAVRGLVIQTVQPFHTGLINPAARKGTREKARKKKVKVVVEKVGFIPHNQRGKDKLNLLRKEKHIDDTWKAVSTDNVWIGRYYRWRIYNVANAIECHRETHHPSMYNEPNAPLNVTIEINMQGEKITRFVDPFQRMIKIPNKFDHGEERHILVLAKGEDLLKEAREAGASLVGGADIIGNIQDGEVKVNDYQFVIAHPNILADIVSVRGLMKKKYPNPRNGSLTADLKDAVQQFLSGIQYKVVRDEYQHNYGKIETCIGTLNMDKTHLEENLVTLLKDVDSVRPKRAGKFITKVLLSSPPSGETLIIDPFVYISEEYTKSVKSKGEEEIDNEHELEVEAKN